MVRYLEHGAGAGRLVVRLEGSRALVRLLLARLYRRGSLGLLLWLLLLLSLLLALLLMQAVRRLLER